MSAHDDNRADAAGGQESGAAKDPRGGVGADAGEGAGRAFGDAESVPPADEAGALRSGGECEQGLLSAADVHGGTRQELLPVSRSHSAFARSPHPIQPA